MGCCNSKPKEKPKAPAPQPKPTRPKPPTPKEDPRDSIPVAAEPVAKSAAELRADRLAAIDESRKKAFRYDHCTVEDGEVHPLFDDGLIYRIIKDGVWYIYNDTLDYEAHVNYRFGPGSQIIPGPRTSLETGADGWITAHALVYPLETIEYISGTYNGFKSDVSIKAVDPEYLSRMAQDSKAIAAAELRAVQRLAGNEWDEEIILRRCIEQNVPYVDVNFPPTDRMMARPGVDHREMAETGMQRPTQYLSDDMKNESDAVIGAVVPESIDSGKLGDCWIGCAAAVMAEDEETIRSMFISTKPEERDVGAYRVALSKHGWWRSVIVDNYLPTLSNTPVFARIADDPRELWVSLLEKAYAKVHGSYAVITGGDALQAIQDFTGAPTYRFDKEWESAAMNFDKVRGFTQKLIRYNEAGYGIVLSTPALTSTSYLGCKQGSNYEAFKKKYTSVGLRCAYTYAVSEMVSVDNVVLFKVHNPWKATATWNGPWSAKSAEWDKHPRARSVCRPEETAPGSFWISWNDAINYFDGGGVVYCTPDAVDYRVKGQFNDVIPSVVLEIEAKEAVTVTLVLSQQDKRGGSDNDAGLRFAPCMLSVAQYDGSRHEVVANSSWDPAAPSAEYNFMVARDMAVTYTFQPSERPYLVVPRIHRKGVSAGYSRPYAFGIISQQALDGKLNIRCTSLDSENRVFKNLIRFDAGSLPAVEAQYQVHRAGEMPKVAFGEMVVGTAPAKAADPETSGSEANISREEEDAPAAQEELEQKPMEVTVTDGSGTPINADGRSADEL